MDSERKLFQMQVQTFSWDIQRLLQEDEHSTNHNIVIPPLEQWAGRSLYEICEVYHYNVLTLIDIYLALLQIHSILIGVGLPSPTMMLFNRLISGLFPQMNTNPIHVNNTDLHFEALDIHQRKYDEGKNTWKDPSVFIARATVAVKQEDWGAWMHDIIGKSNNHRWHSFTTLVTRSRRLIMQNLKHTHDTTVRPQEYLCQQIKNIRAIGGHFCTSSNKGSHWAPKTMVHKHHHRKVSEPKFAFPKQGKKSWQNSCSPWYGGQRQKYWAK